MCFERESVLSNSRDYNNHDNARMNTGLPNDSASSHESEDVGGQKEISS